MEEDDEELSPDDEPDEPDEPEDEEPDEPDDEELSPDDDGASPSDDEDSDLPLSAPLLAALVPAGDPPRSFFAQPDPLKWIAGVVNCLRIIPSWPQDGQKLGPGSLIPWRMSARWSQLVQR